jgi:hypothetical protein
LHRDTADLAGDLLCGGLAAAVVDRDPRARPRELTRDRRSDSARPSGDEGDFSFE